MYDNSTQEKTKRRLLVFGSLSVAMMVVIFAFSAMDGTLSTSQSNGIAFWIGSHVIEGFENMSEAEKLAAIHGFTYPIRKTAHVTEYAILGGLLTATWWQAAKLHGNANASGMRRAWGLGFLCAVLYACTDEFHQTFTPGRTGQPIDVCIDSIGILIGTLVAIGLVSRARKAKEGQGPAAKGA